MALEFGTTSHGMEVFVDHMPGMQTARIALDVEVGSIHEQPGEEGLAHVLEHAVHLRTPRFKQKSDLTRFQGINAIGANAYTNFTHTEYHGKGPDVAPIVEMLGEVVTRPQFVPEDIDPEMEVITEEVRQRLNNFSLLHGLSVAHTITGGPYGRDISGHLRDLTYKTEDVEDFYEKYYTYENMKLWGVGNVTVDELVRYAEEHFSPLPVAPITPQRGAVRNNLEEDMRTGYILSKSETTYHSIAVQCGNRLVREIMDNPFAFKAAQSVLSSHAKDVLRNREGIAYGAWVYVTSYDHPDAWTLRTYTTAAPEHLAKVDTSFAEVLSRPVEQYSEQDVLAGIGSCRSRILSIMDSIGERAALHRDHLDMFGEPQELHALADRVRSLDVYEVRAAMGRMLSYFASMPKLTHVTGTAEAVGDVDVMISQDDII